MADAALMARLAEDAFETPPRSIAVMSTGVIGPRLPMDRIRSGAELAAKALGSQAARDAAAEAAARL